MSEPDMSGKAWQYEEMSHTGRDFADRRVVEAYDAFHRRFRDIDAENEAIIVGLGLQAGQSVADFGCGTGAFALQAAQRCSRVYAIDISTSMLDYARDKAQQLGLTNIFFCHDGFLTYVHKDEPVDAVATSMALHHLPDFWKQKALCRLSDMLRPGGRLFLADVVFAEENCEANIGRWMETLGATAGPEVVRSIREHVREEYSTFGWIMDGLLNRAGFHIDRCDRSDGVLAGYYCTKTISH